jgi:hypothetical protein
MATANENTMLFRALSRICRRSRDIIGILETAKREAGLKVGGIGPFNGYRLGRAGVGLAHTQITTQFWLGIGIFL